MADQAYDDMIRREERARIARLLRENADALGSFAAPGRLVDLVAFLIDRDSVDTQ